MTSNYVSFHGVVLTDYVDIEGVTEDGSDIKFDAYSGPDQDKAKLSNQGVDPSIFTFEVHHKTRAAIEEIIAELRTSPEDIEFYPRTDDRCVYASFASASRPKSFPFVDNGTNSIYNYASISVQARNAYAVGAESGISLDYDVTLPQSTTITNAGYYNNTFDYLYMSGGYTSLDGYTTDLLLTIGDYELILCDKLLWKDKFKVDRFGRVAHSKYTDFPMNYENLQNAFHGSDFIDYGTGGGSLEYQAFHMGNSGKLIYSFYGPLPVLSNPYMEVVISDLVGYPEVELALTSDLSDILPIDFELQNGINKVYIPECDGLGNIFFGITTDENSSLTIESINAEVQRYVAEDELPVVDYGDSVTATISDGEHSNHILEAMHFVYRDLY